MTHTVKRLKVRWAVENIVCPFRNKFWDIVSGTYNISLGKFNFSHRKKKFLILNIEYYHHSSLNRRKRKTINRLKPFHSLNYAVNYLTHLIQIEFCVFDAFRLDLNWSTKLCVIYGGNILRAINNRFQKSSSTDLMMEPDDIGISFPYFLFLIFYFLLKGKTDILKYYQRQW